MFQYFAGNDWLNKMIIQPGIRIIEIDITKINNYCKKLKITVKNKNNYSIKYAGVVGLMQKWIDRSQKINF